jgi:hypothetical protein
MRHVRRIGVVMIAALAIAALLPRVASAHEQRDVDGGKYTFVVGFLNEPAVTGVWNSLDLRVAANTGAAATPAAGGGDEALTGTPVEGLESTLQVEIIYGDQKKTLTLEPRFGEAGAYNAYVIPTAAGDYSFHIFGTINGDAIDETFTSSPEGFSSVEDAANYQFPAPSATNTGTVAGTLGGGLAVGLALGAAGIWLVRRRGTAVRRPALVAGLRAGAGD